MDTKSIGICVDWIRIYLHSPSGRARKRERMQGQGWPYKRFVAEAVAEMGVERYKDIGAIIDEVLILELAPEKAVA